ncbi:hypothetical protein NQ318_011436 [Aromia moschata]|uniref:K Homology domain-containing protein n=1 Tax=Aromia moschata TaxID=1265417 RepID=A0AAV8YST2_9CUCU|nr:hypothetical protein NQ318_011436 [Aromia moschata]
MQQPVIEEGAAYEPSVRSYDDLFPALPESTLQQNNNSIGQWGNNKMRVGSSIITQVFRVPFEERKMESSQKFGEGESNHICALIMKESGAHIEISHAKDQSLTFLVTGKSNEVLEARRKILTHFQTQASKQISIPKEHHRWILGKKGDRLKDLEKTTATKILIPPMNENSDVITITGTKEGIEKAEHEIRVTSDQQSKKASERLNIPKHFHPFIVGPYGRGLAQLIEETGARINVPPTSVMKDEIFIAGEKEGVMAAKARIEDIYKRMEKKSATVSVEVPKSQHKYVIGPKGQTIAEILDTTGVSVEMPQKRFGHSSEETQKTQNITKSRACAVGLASMHPHVYWCISGCISRPDRESETIKNRLPGQDSNNAHRGTITLRGPHDKLGLALSVVYEKANSVRSSDVDAPSWLHKYIIGRKGANIKEITQNLPKVHVEFTDKEDKIKIEGPPEEVEKAQEQIEVMAKDLIGRMTFMEMHVDPKLFKHIIGKSGANINKLKEDFNVVINIEESGLVRIEGNKDDVTSTQAELEQRIFKLENEKEKDVIIEQRHYRNIIGTKGENIKEIRDRFNQVQIYFPGPGDRNDIVKVRGPKEDVDKCARHLEKLVKELNESSHQIEVPIYKQFHKFIIGKGGANIRKIREETNTKIDLPAEGDKNDVITITGKRENVEEAREKIRKIQDELENIVSEEITIPPEVLQLPHRRQGQTDPLDNGGVWGPKEDVDRAKRQLLDLANERQLASYTAEVRAKAQHHKFLIGKNGANIKKIRDSTGARIVFPSNTDEDREVITIIGKKEAVEEAKAALEATIKDIVRQHHRERDAGGAAPPQALRCAPRRGPPQDIRRVRWRHDLFPEVRHRQRRVVLKGPKECIEAAKQRINEIISDLESMITIECVISQKHHRTVMGSKGHKVQGITGDFDVQIKFPDRDNQEEYFSYEQVNGDVNTEPIRHCDVIRITGKEANCLQAKQALLDLVPVTINVDVPFDLHRSIIGQKGRVVKELMDSYDVHIVLSPADVKEDVIKITGTPANVERAKEALRKRVKDLEADRRDRELRSFALKIEVNPEYHPKIIGKKGAVITKIREGP